MDKTTEQQEWERFKGAVGHLVFALSQTLLQLSPAGRDIVLGPWYGLTPETLVGWTGRELAQTLAESLMTIVATLLEEELAAESLLDGQYSYPDGWTGGIQPSVN